MERKSVSTDSQLSVLHEMLADDARFQSMEKEEQALRKANAQIGREGYQLGGFSNNRLASLLKRNDCGSVGLFQCANQGITSKREELGVSIKEETDGSLQDNPSVVLARGMKKWRNRDGPMCTKRTHESYFTETVKKIGGGNYIKYLQEKYPKCTSLIDGNASFDEVVAALDTSVLRKIQGCAADIFKMFWGCRRSLQEVTAARSYAKQSALKQCNKLFNFELAMDRSYTEYMKSFIAEMDCVHLFRRIHDGSSKNSLQFVRGHQKMSFWNSEVQEEIDTKLSLQDLLVRNAGWLDFECIALSIFKTLCEFGDDLKRISPNDSLFLNYILPRESYLKMVASERYCSMKECTYEKALENLIKILKQMPTPTQWELTLLFTEGFSEFYREIRLRLPQQTLALLADMDRDKFLVQRLYGWLRYCILNMIKSSGAVVMEEDPDDTKLIKDTNAAWIFPRASLPAIINKDVRTGEIETTVHGSNKEQLMRGNESAPFVDVHFFVYMDGKSKQNRKGKREDGEDIRRQVVDILDQYSANLHSQPQSEFKFDLEEFQKYFRKQLEMRELLNFNTMTFIPSFEIVTVQGDYHNVVQHVRLDPQETDLKIYSVQVYKPQPYSIGVHNGLWWKRVEYSTADIVLASKYTYLLQDMLEMNLRLCSQETYHKEILRDCNLEKLSLLTREVFKGENFFVALMELNSSIIAKTLAPQTLSSKLIMQEFGRYKGRDDDTPSVSKVLTRYQIAGQDQIQWSRINGYGWSHVANYPMVAIYEMTYARMVIFKNMPKKSLYVPSCSKNVSTLLRIFGDEKEEEKNSEVIIIPDDGDDAEQSPIYIPQQVQEHFVVDDDEILDEPDILDPGSDIEQDEQEEEESKHQQLANVDWVDAPRLEEENKRDYSPELAHLSPKEKALALTRRDIYPWVSKCNQCGECTACADDTKYQLDIFASAVSQLLQIHKGSGLFKKSNYKGSRKSSSMAFLGMELFRQLQTAIIHYMLPDDKVPCKDDLFGAIVRNSSLRSMPLLYVRSFVNHGAFDRVWGNAESRKKYTSKNRETRRELFANGREAMTHLVDFCLDMQVVLKLIETADETSRLALRNAKTRWSVLRPSVKQKIKFTLDQIADWDDLEKENAEELWQKAHKMKTEFDQKCNQQHKSEQKPRLGSSPMMPSTGQGARGRDAHNESMSDVNLGEGVKCSMNEIELD